MPLYPIKTPVKWKGKVRSKGHVDMPAEIADPLIGIGTLGEAVARTSTSSQAPPKKTTKKKVVKKTAKKKVSVKT